MANSAPVRRIRRPGLYRIAAARYHSDPAPAPSLSHSIMRELIDKSPRHARFAHPRLNPDFEARTPTDEMVEGTVLHWLILGAGARPVVIQRDDFRTKEAREARDAAHAAGRAPILAWKMAEMKKIAREVTGQLREMRDARDFFAPGRSEVAAFWQEGPVWCRCMVDRLPTDPGAPMFDLKSTDKSANPAAWERQTTERFATQAVFYGRGIAAGEASTPREMRFILFERKPPYGVSLISPGVTVLERAEEQVKQAVMTWARCLILGEWPGYPTDVQRPELAAWQLIDAALERAATPKPLNMAA